MNLESFGNDKYILLKYFYDNQILVNNDKIVITNKQMVADALHFRKDKVICLINECLGDETLERVASRGKYRLTLKGYKIIELFMNLDI